MTVCGVKDRVFADDSEADWDGAVTADRTLQSRFVSNLSKWSAGGRADVGWHSTKLDCEAYLCKGENTALAMTQNMT